MNKIAYNPRWLAGLALAVALGVASCRSGYEVARVEGNRVAMDSTWDAHPSAEALALLAPYKAGVDSMMQQVLGTSAMSMDRYRPESPLSNLVADVLRQAATDVLGKPADMGLVNIGGIRNSLTQGPITMATAYELLPFENSLCVLTLKGDVLRQLFENIAGNMGEGVSGVRLQISRDGRLLDATIGGKLLDENRTYTVATIDYLAEGNDGMRALPLAESRICPPGATLRSLFIAYVERLEKSGQAVAARIEGRVTLKD